MKKNVKLKEGATKKSLTSKSRASRASGNIIMATDQMYQIALKSSISSLVSHCSKEILVEISKFLNIIFSKLKDHCLNTVMPNDTVKRRELAWENVTKKSSRGLVSAITGSK
jgi:lipopolysaccharide biosynthesis glycosyltransferase